MRRSLAVSIVNLIASHYNLDHLVAEWQKKYSEHRFSNIFLRFVSFLENISPSALQGDI